MKNRSSWFKCRFHLHKVAEKGNSCFNIVIIMSLERATQLFLSNDNDISYQKKWISTYPVAGWRHLFTSDIAQPPISWYRVSLGESAHSSVVANDPKRLQVDNEDSDQSGCSDSTLNAFKHNIYCQIACAFCEDSDQPNVFIWTAKIPISHLMLI